MSRFERGAAYYATPCMRGAPRLVVSVTAREGNRVMFAEPSPVRTEWVREFDGREVAQVRDAEGMVYTLSSAAPADLGAAQELVDILGVQLARRIARRGRFFFGGRGMQ